MCVTAASAAIRVTTARSSAGTVAGMPSTTTEPSASTTTRTAARLLDQDGLRRVHGEHGATVGRSADRSMARQ